MHMTTREKPGLEAVIRALILKHSNPCAGFGPPWYSCDSASCSGECMCPSLTAPGALSPDEVPQFVLITHDDAITPLADMKVRSVTDGHRNPNGCNVPATWFVTTTGTDCNLAKTLLEQNHELAMHTISHPALSASLGNAKLTEEIVGARDELSNTCGIPKDSVVGFRAPFLVHNEEVRKILSSNGFLYDSSMVEFLGELSETSKTFSQRLWPYTMDNGIIQNCNWTTPSGTCAKSERYPGFWEVPIWDLPNDTVSMEKNAFTMDPDGGFGGDLFTLFQTNFDEAYNGNRAPFPIFVHAPWFTDERIQLTNKFIEYALSKPGVYFVTITQLINWMKNPVPVSQMNEALKCNAVDFSGPPEKKKCRTYVVQSGDYLELIASKFGLLDFTEITSINPDITAKNIQPGQVMKIPPFDSTCGKGSPDGVPVASDPTDADQTSEPAPISETISSNNAAETTNNIAIPSSEPLVTSGNEESSKCTWEVKKDETLIGISEALGTDLEEIMTANALADMNVGLQIGQILNIPSQLACCETNSCGSTKSNGGTVAPKEPIPSPEINSVEDQQDNSLVEISFSGTTAEGNSFPTTEDLKKTLSFVYSIDINDVDISVSASRRRMFRRSLQDSALQSTYYMVSCYIETNEPEAFLAQAKVLEPELKNALAAAGVQLDSVPSYQMTTQQSNGVDDRQEDVANSVVATEEPQSTKQTQDDSNSLSRGAIIGISVGGAIALILLVLLVFVYLRKRRNSPQTNKHLNKSNDSSMIGGSAQIRIAGETNDSKVVTVATNQLYDTN